MQKANEEFYLLHPDRKNRPLTQDPDDSTLRSEWLKIYSKHAGKNAIKTPKKISSAPVYPLNKEKKAVGYSIKMLENGNYESIRQNL